MKRRDWLFKFLLLNYLFIFILCAQCFICMYMQHMCAVHTEARRGHWIPRNWCHSQLWAAMGLLGARPESSARTCVLECYITPSILLKLYAAEAQWILEEYSRKRGDRSALAQTIVTSRPHDVPASQKTTEKPPSPILYSSVSDSCRDRMTISVLRLRHHKYQSAALSLLDADLNDLMPSLAHLSLNHYHSHSCRPFLRRWKTEVRNGSYRCHDPCGSHKNSPNHEEIPITMDLSQTIHLLHNDHSMPPETFSLLKECLVRDLMTTQYTADAVLSLWSKYLGHGKNRSKSENNMRQKRKDRGRDANGIAQRQRRLCAKLKRRYPRRGQNCAKPHCFALLMGLHNNLSQGSEAVKLIKLFPVSRR